jgi:nitroimidazol reductase NimA-like FMN-containing flavoprotein (pyridoxamine 5'-phosphate oxidase superfamily)
LTVVDASSPGNEECQRLLDSTSMGRLGYRTGLGPLIVPMNYRLVSEAVIFRTAWTPRQPWPEGRRPLVVQLPLTMMTGRRVHPSKTP